MPFVPDKPSRFTPDAPEQAKPSLWDQTKRQAGLGVRAVAEGGMDLVAPFADPLAMGLNKVLPGDPLPENHSQAFSGLLTSAGLPEPQGGAERFSNVASRMITGAAAGGLIDKAVMGGLGLARAPTMNAAAPTSDQLRQWSRAAYKGAEDAGVVVSPESFANRVGTLVGNVAKEGIDPTLHPQATAALKRLTSVVQEGRPIALQELETLRKVIKGAAGSISADERRIARIMADEVDDYVLGLGQSDVLAGAPEQAGRLLSEARNLWSRSAKSETVQTLIERAQERAKQFSGSGYENALRTEFRQLVMNPKRMRLFTPAEQGALRTVSRGGPVGNVLRYLGKLAPTGAVSAAISGGAGAVIAGGPGAVALPAAGYAAREGATALTARNARLAAEMMRRGGPAAATPLLDSAAPAIAGGIGLTPALIEQLRRRQTADQLRQ